MNILLASTGGHIGGEETFTRNLAISLINRGHNVWVAPGGDIQLNDLVNSNIPLAEIDIKGRSLWRLFKGASNIKSFIVENSIDIVHCQSVGPALMGVIITRMKGRKGEKWIYHGHGIKSLTYKWFPPLLNSLDFTITCSDHEQIKLKSCGVIEDRIVRVHNGINPDDFTFTYKIKEDLRTKFRKEFGINENDFLLGYIGRLSPEKGCDLIIPTIHKLRNSIPSVRFVIVGDGILREDLEREVSRLNLKDKVIFAGFRSDIPGILTCLDTLVLPSYRETFSLTSLQAMGSGIPVIASDAGGNPEQVINNFNGFLFETGSIDSFVGRINQMYESKKRSEMGYNGRMLVEKYLNTNRMVDEIEYIYFRSN